MKQKRVQALAARLRVKLQHGRHYTLEVLAKQYRHSCGEVRAALVVLCRLPGWSVRPHNWPPYWPRRGPLFSRRRKGEPRDYDRFEPEWVRTVFKVRTQKKETT